MPKGYEKTSSTKSLNVGFSIGSPEVALVKKARKKVGIDTETLNKISADNKIKKLLIQQKKLTIEKGNLRDNMERLLKEKEKWQKRVLDLKKEVEAAASGKSDVDQNKLKQELKASEEEFALASQKHAQAMEALKAKETEKKVVDDILSQKLQKKEMYKEFQLALAHTMLHKMLEAEWNQTLPVQDGSGKELRGSQMLDAEYLVTGYLYYLGVLQGVDEKKLQELLQNCEKQGWDLVRGKSGEPLGLADSRDAPFSLSEFQKMVFETYKEVMITGIGAKAMGKIGEFKGFGEAVSGVFKTDPCSSSKAGQSRAKAAQPLQPREVFFSNPLFDQHTMHSNPLYQGSSASTTATPNTRPTPDKSAGKEGIPPKPPGSHPSAF